MDNKPRLQSILRNPLTDILYKNCRPDILKKLEEKTNLPKEKLFSILDISEEEWAEKLKTSKFTTKEMLEIAEKGKITFCAGRNTGKYETYVPVSKEDFYNTISNLLEKTVNEIEKKSLTKNKKGLISKCCGATVMNSVKDTESIKKTCSEDNLFENLNQCLYALSICIEYSPDETDSSSEKEKEELIEKTKKNLGLVPYSEPVQIRKIEEAIKKFIEEEDPLTLQTIIGLKNKPKGEKIREIPISQFVRLMSITGNNSFVTDKTSAKLDKKDAVNNLLQQISITTSKIPANIKEQLAVMLDIPQDYLEKHPEAETEQADYIIKMSVVTNNPLKFSKSCTVKDKKDYEEEKKLLSDMEDEERKNSTQETSQQETIEEANTDRKEEEQMRKQVKTIQDKKEPEPEAENLISRLIPIMRSYYDIEIDETFKFKGKELKVIKENNIEKIIDSTGLEINFEKHQNIFYSMFSGDEKNFEREKFMPKEGQEYWTFNIPTNLDIIKRVFGENQIADLISSKFDIVYKNQKEIQKVNINDIIKRMTA